MMLPQQQKQSLPLTIIVGTGRCGSTMLTRILQLHPDVLSLSEFWHVFPSDEKPPEDRLTQAMSGEAFWQRICKPDPYADSFVLSGLVTTDPYPAERGRFDYAAGLPSICRVLAPLTDDPDELYDQLAPRVSSWPDQSVSEHCSALFTELAVTLGRRVIVERTAGSLNFLSLLHQQFPEARFVYLHRDGPDCVLSMSRNYAFRLVAMRAMVTAVTSGHPDLPKEILPVEIRSATAADFEGLISPPFDKQRFMNYPIPLILFASIWSGATRRGTSEIRKLPHDEWIVMRYEKLLSVTRQELAGLASFIGADAQQQWLDNACEFIDAKRTGKAISHLHPSDLVALRSACVSGTKAFDLLESEHAAADSYP